MSHARARARGHRRAASCYNLDFDNLVADQSRPSDQSETVKPQSVGNLDGFDYIASFLKPKERESEEPSIIVDAIESTTELKQRKELGLKFSSAKTAIVETQNKAKKKSGSSLRMVECGESPKSAQSRDRIQKIQVKYVTDLQKIDEDMHEMSLANSRNSLGLKNSAQKTLARIVRASGSGRKVLSEVSAYDNLILEEFEVENTREGNEVEVSASRKIEYGDEKENIPTYDVIMETESDQLDSIKGPSSFKPKSYTIMNYQKRNLITVEPSVEMLKNESNLANKSNYSDNPEKPWDETIKSPCETKRSYFLSNNFQNSSKTLNSQFIGATNNQSSDCSIHLIEKGNKLMIKSKAEANSRNCLKSTLQRLYNERQKKQSSSAAAKNLLASNVGRTSVNNHSQERQKSRPHTPTITASGSRAAILNYRPRATEVSGARSNCRSSKRRTPSDIGIERTKEIKKDSQVKRRSCSISLQPNNPTLQKSASGTVGVNRRAPSIDVKEGSLIDLKNIISAQQMTLTHLRSRVQTLESENKLVNKKYFSLKQENKRLQQELTSAIAASMSNARAFKAATSKTDRVISIR